MERIKPAEFQVLNQKEDITILDVREVDEFQAGHIEGALNAPLSTLDKEYEQLDSSKRYYVICQGGMRSERAKRRIQCTLNMPCLEFIHFPNV